MCLLKILVLLSVFKYLIYILMYIQWRFLICFLQIMNCTGIICWTKHHFPTDIWYKYPITCSSTSEPSVPFFHLSLCLIPHCLNHYGFTVRFNIKQGKCSSKFILLLLAFGLSLWILRSAYQAAQEYLTGFFFNCKCTAYVDSFVN